MSLMRPANLRRFPSGENHIRWKREKLFQRREKSKAHRLACSFAKFIGTPSSCSASSQTFDRGEQELGAPNIVAVGWICVKVAAMRRTTRRSFVAWIFFCAFLAVLPLYADQVQMLNGDHYAGKILSLNSNSIVFESDVLGKVTLPREKVTSMNFGANAATNAPAPVPSRVVAATNRLVRSNTNIAVALRNGTNAVAIEQVRQQMLAGTTPEVNQKYDELLGGLMSGKLSVNDIRAQARTAIDQINKIKRETPQADPMLDAYLEILENFVNEAEPTATTKPALPAPPSGIVAAPATPAAPTASFGTNPPSLQGK